MIRLLAVVLWLVAVAGHAADPLTALQPGTDVARGTFTQQKHLAELERPLTSSGRFVAARGHGLIWRVRKPVETTLIVGRKHLIKRRDGHRTLRVDADEQPGLRVIAAILLASFRADEARLRQYFDIEKNAESDTDWRMRLTPTADSVAEFIDHVTIRGDTRVRRIAIDEAGGDRSVIRLQTVEPDPDGLTETERAGFTD